MLQRVLPLVTVLLAATAGVAFAQVPDLLITGDGRLFRPGMQTMVYPGPVLPSITVGSITPVGIERLLAVAQAEGLLSEPVPAYAPNDQVADAPNTAVDLQANGLQLHHEAYGLGFVPEAGPADSAGAVGLDLGDPFATAGGE